MGQEPTSRELHIRSGEIGDKIKGIVVPPNQKEIEFSESQSSLFNRYSEIFERVNIQQQARKQFEQVLRVLIPLQENVMEHTYGLIDLSLDCFDNHLQEINPQTSLSDLQKKFYRQQIVFAGYMHDWGKLVNPQMFNDHNDEYFDRRCINEHAQLSPIILHRALPQETTDPFLLGIKLGAAHHLKNNEINQQFSGINAVVANMISAMDQLQAIIFDKSRTYKKTHQKNVGPEERKDISYAILNNIIDQKLDPVITGVVLRNLQNDIQKEELCANDIDIDIQKIIEALETEMYRSQERLTMFRETFEKRRDG